MQNLLYLEDISVQKHQRQKGGGEKWPLEWCFFFSNGSVVIMEKGLLREKLYPRSWHWLVSVPVCFYVIAWNFILLRNNHCLILWQLRSFHWTFLSKEGKDNKENNLPPWLELEQDNFPMWFVAVFFCFCEGQWEKKYSKLRLNSQQWLKSHISPYLIDLMQFNI